MSLKSALVASILSVVVVSSCGGSAAPAAADAVASKPSSVAESRSAVPSESSTAGTAALTKLKASYAAPDASTLPIWLAKDAGLFQKHGLDVDLQIITGGSPQIAALIAGSVQMANGGAQALEADIHGAAIKFVAILVPVYTLVLEGAPGITSAAELKGKQVGIGTPGGPYDTSARVALKSQGLDPDKDVKLTSFASADAVGAALISGQVPAAMAGLPQRFVYEARGFHPIIDVAGTNHPAAFSALYTTQDFITSNRATVQNYVDALIEAIALAKSDKKQALATLKHYTQMDDDSALSATYDYYARDFVTPRLPFPKVEQFNDNIDSLAMKDAGVRGFEVARVIDASFVQSAANRGLGQAKG